MISGARLRQAREAIGMTQGELAVASGLAQPVLSKIEVGARVATREEAFALAGAVETPVAFLFRDPVLLPEGSLGLFRSTSSKVKSAEYSSARRLAEIGVEVLSGLSDGSGLPAIRIRSLSMSETESAAMYARSMLRLPPDEPIKNLTLAMERAGVFVLRLRDISPHIAGFGAWVEAFGHGSEGSRPLVVTRRPLGPFRLRFTLAHELGHLVLGHQVFTGPKAPVEKDANLFAQALLMPEQPAREDLASEPLSMERLALLKGKWGVSMNAVAMRAKHLGIISEGGYYSIYEGLRFRGWLKQEPGDQTTVCEEPSLLRELARRRGVSLDAYSLAEAVSIGVAHARCLLSEHQDVDLSTLLRT